MKNQSNISARQKDKLKKSFIKIFPEVEVNVKAMFYNDIACEFSISVKSIYGGLYDMLRMFACYFALLEFHKTDEYSGLDKERKKVLEQIAAAIANEIGRHDLKGGEKAGTQMFEKWIKNSFQSLKSGHGGLL